MDTGYWMLDTGYLIFDFSFYSMKNYLSLFAICSLAILQWACNAASADDVHVASMANPSVSNTASTALPVLTATNDAATILNRPEVPILCYHQLRDWKSSDSRTAKDYIVPVSSFREQMKILADSGYHTISPDQLVNYLTKGASLPSKPVMITFDDTRVDQYTVALPELNKYGFKGVFFIMTVSLGRPGYMETAQVKQLSDEGHTIGSHTWDHKNIKKYTVDDWVQQIQKPSKQLETITGKPVDYFAYPFGLWNKEAVAKLKDHEFKAVFQLSDLRDNNDPLYTIRRIIVPGEWSAGTMLRVMRRSFLKVKS
jgi:peptidoglycan/xylan/chitin deacetylase (PgdA/CDA1 family)